MMVSESKMWLRVGVTLSTGNDAEIVSADLWAMGASGIQLRDEETFSEFDDGAAVVAFFDPDHDQSEIERCIGEMQGLELLSSDLFGEEDWAEGWKQHFKPTLVSPNVVVRPTWNDNLPQGNHRAVVVLDPGMAFGTGTHETTRMCLGIIDDQLCQLGGLDLLDVGCGSGILSIAAAKLSLETILGIDCDPDAVAVARENWTLNGLGSPEEAPFSTQPLTEVGQRYGLVVANMLSGILLRLRSALIASVAPGGLLVLSGVLSSESERFLDSFVGGGMELRTVHRDGEWMAFELRKQ